MREFKLRIDPSIALSIVVPVFNEEKNLPLLIEEYEEIAKRHNIELILVEDSGSTDNTRHVIAELSNKYSWLNPLFINQRGYGISIYKGLRQAKGEFLCWTHADLQTNPKDTIRALKIIQKKNEPKRYYVKGKRKGRPLMDSFFAGGMSVFETLILGRILKDINAQPNLIHRSFLTLLTNPPSDFSFDLFSYFTAKKKNLQVIRFPVYFPKRVHGTSSWNTGLLQKWKFIKRTIGFSWRLQKRLA